MRIAIRRLTASPIFSIFSIVTLALGIGVVTAVYSVMYVTFARPLGVEDTGGLVILTRAAAMNRTAPAMLSWPDFQDLTAQQRSFSEVLAWRSVGDVLAGAARSEQTGAEAVSGRYFSALGVSAALGRVIQAQDDQPGAPAVIVLSDVIWRQQFDADPAVIGSMVRFGGQSLEVIGVAPVGFRGIHRQTVGQVGVWLPIAALTGRTFDFTRRDHPAVFVAGRLAPQASSVSATMDVSTIAARLDEAAPLPVPAPSTGIPNPVRPRRSWEATPLADSTGLFSNEGVRIVVALPFLVLLVACTNLANLILSRGTSRRHEYALRGALGASRWRLVREHLTETALIAIAGGAFGVLTTHALLVWAVSSVRDIVEAMAPGFPLVWRMEPVVFVAVGVCVLLALAIGGAVPAWHLTRVDPGRMLTIGDADAALPRWRGRSNLIALQVGVSTALFLITLTFVRFIVFDPPVRNFVRYDGLESVALASVQIDPRRGIDDFVEQVIAELRRMPGVAAASASTNAPYSTIRGAFGAGYTVEVTRPGQPFALRDPRYRTAALYVTPEFARTASLTIVRGRFLTAADAASGMAAVVIDESIAQAVFGSLDVVGRTLLVRDDPAAASEAVIVGVTAMLGRAPADVLARSQHLYAPFVSRPAGDPRIALYSRVVLMARSHDADAAPLVGALRTAVRRVTPDIAVGQAGRGDVVAAGPFALLEFAGVVFGGLAVLALGLSMAGLYGVLSHVVDRRRREMGIRIALGAERARVARLILRQGFRPIMEGLFIGTGVALVLRQLLQLNVTAALSPIDIATFALAAVPLVATGLVACYLPARRAAGVNPLDALRQL